MTSKVNRWRCSRGMMRPLFFAWALWLVTSHAAAQTAQTDPDLNQQAVVTTSKGAFGGGGYAEMKTTLASKLNDGIYGKNTSASQILAAQGGKYAPAIKLRQVLSQMVVEAWE